MQNTTFTSAPRAGDSAPGRGSSEPTSTHSESGSRSEDAVVVRLSPEARQRIEQANAGEATGPDTKPQVLGQDEAAGREATEEATSSRDDEEKTEEKRPVRGSGEVGRDGERLTEEEVAEVRSLEKRDREVRVHESAHLAAAGRHAKGGVHLDFESGPDGGRYAVSGHVNMDVGKEGDPKATIEKAQTIQRAALAPADPSAQDRSVAANASRMEQSARSELQAALAEEAESGEETKKVDDSEAEVDRAETTDESSARLGAESLSVFA